MDEGVSSVVGAADSVAVRAVDSVAIGVVDSVVVAAGSVVVAAGVVKNDEAYSSRLEEAYERMPEQMAS